MPDYGKKSKFTRAEIDAALERAMTLPLPNASMSKKWGNFGGADAGKFDYWASLFVTEYSNGVVDVFMHGKFYAEAADTDRYGIDVLAVISAINELTGKNYSNYDAAHIQVLDMDVVDSVKGSHLTGIAGYALGLGHNPSGSKPYLQISRFYTQEGAVGPWWLAVVAANTSDGNAYMNLHLRMQLF